MTYLIIAAKSNPKVGDQLVHDHGHLTALDHPKVKEIAEKYPERPGLNPWPKSF